MGSPPRLRRGAKRRRPTELVRTRGKGTMTAMACGPPTEQQLRVPVHDAISTVAFSNIDVLPGAAVATNATLSVSCLSVPASNGSLYVCVALPARLMQGA